MSDSSETVQRETPRQTELRLSEELERLGGVLAAAVRLGEGTELRDVFIAAAEASALPAIRDAAAETLRRAGLHVSPAVIRIGTVGSAAGLAGLATAAPGADPAEPLTPWQSRFLLLDAVHVHRTGNRAHCTVQLLRLEEMFEGEGEDLDTEMGRARAAARATLAAAEKAAPSALALEGMQLTEMFGRRYIVASVEANAARRHLVLTGILSLDNVRSLEEAAALAALRAIERFISW